MSSYRFQQVDVFTDRPFYGNPVAVVLEANDISDEEMQRIAAWTNLSETTFVQRPTVAEADYRLRIFTPAGELRFAGHPTVGSAHAILESGVATARDGVMRQECGAGVLKLTVEAEEQRRIYVEAPEAKFVREHHGLWKGLGEALGHPIGEWAAPTSFDNGPVWLFARFDDAADIGSLEPDMSALTSLCREQSVTGVAAFALPEGSGPRVRIRCFAPAVGVPEDPVTGSANAALPAYLAHHGMLAPIKREYVATQGTEMGRDGRVFVRVLDARGRTEIGGHSVTAIEGEIRL